MPSGRSVPRGIVQQVGDDAFEQGWICRYHRSLLQALGADRGGIGGQSVQGGGQHFHQVGRTPVQLQRPCLEAAHVEEVLDEAVEPGHRLVGSGEEFVAVPRTELHSVLAVGLVLASAAVVGYVASVLTPLSWQMGLVLGAILASTDPVAVTALGRRLALPPRVQVMVQAESLFDDATSLVLFRVAVSVAVAASVVSWGSAGGEFALLAGGGTLIGAAVAGVVQPPTALPWHSARRSSS